MNRPFVTLKCAVSLDGYLDDSSQNRLILSSPEDLDAVDKLRAESDAVFVGANTIRQDNPSLLVKSQEYLRDCAQPKKVTFSKSLDIDPHSKFFTTGECEKFLYVPESSRTNAEDLFGEVATCVAIEVGPVKLEDMLSDLWERGITSLLVEAGENVSSQFIERGLVDTLRIAIAPVVLGTSGASRFAAQITTKVTGFQIVDTESLGSTHVLWLNPIKN